MPSNIEIKARLIDPEFVKKTSLELSETKKADILEQEDTFFNCEKGRLKLRVFKVSKHKGLRSSCDTDHMIALKIGEKSQVRKLYVKNCKITGFNVNNAHNRAKKYSGVGWVGVGTSLSKIQGRRKTGEKNEKKKSRKMKVAKLSTWSEQMKF